MTIQVDEKQHLAELKAKKELDQLQENDATSAFASLQQSEEIQKKVIEQSDAIEAEDRKRLELKVAATKPKTV